MSRQYRQYYEEHRERIKAQTRAYRLAHKAQKPPEPDLPEEEWRATPGWPYSVSNQGRVRNCRNGHVLEHCYDSDGYAKVVLNDAPRRRNNAKIHMLVSEAFLGPQPPGAQVNHKDGNKRNSAADNLEWVTPKQNMQHAHNKGLAVDRSGMNNPMAKLTNSDVADIHRKYYAGNVTHHILADEFNVSRATISLLLNGKRWAKVSI